MTRKEALKVAIEALTYSQKAIRDYPANPIRQEQLTRVSDAQTVLRQMVARL